MKFILKQTSWLFFAQLFSRIIGFLYTVFLARNLDVENFGLLSAALAYFTLLSTISEFGVNRFLIREIAKGENGQPKLIMNVALFRLVFSAILFSVFATALYLLDSDTLRVGLTVLATIAILPQAIAQTLDCIFIAKQKLQISALSLLLSNLFIVILGVFLVRNGYGTIGAVNALIWGQVLYFILLIFFLRNSHILKLEEISFKNIKTIITSSVPYGLLGVLGLVYFRIDTILLSYLRGNYETGIYGAAYKFLEAVVIIPFAFQTALFPVITKLHQHNQDIKRLYFNSIKLMAFLGIFTTLIFYLLLPFLITAFLPNYIQSILALRILALAIPFMFIHVAISTIVLSTEKYLGKIILISLIPLIFNIVANLVFIPKFGFLAASWITVLSDILSLILIFIFIKRYVLGNEQR